MIAHTQQVSVKAQGTIVLIFNLVQQVAKAQDGVHHPPGFAFHGLNVVRSLGFFLAPGSFNVVLHVPKLFVAEHLAPVGLHETLFGRLENLQALFLRGQFLQRNFRVHRSDFEFLRRNLFTL